MESLKLWNTRTRKVEEFKTISGTKEVGMYCCGPTVYHYAHIGNLRTYVFEDILRRVLEYNKYNVNHVMNITDVGHLTSDADEGEDKMLKGARREGKTVWDIAKYYEEAFLKDIDLLNVKRPITLARATDHIKEMIEMVKKLIENDHAYIANENVYFSIDSFPTYKDFAKLVFAEDVEDKEKGARVEIDSHKRNPHDFVLWFTKSKFQDQEMKWDSPWGIGYPGWHIECSAMAAKYLGEQFDIHCGGVDHIPVHHTNEIAQTECTFKKSPAVKYWLHGEFLNVADAKMSKSTGDFLTLQKIISEGYDALEYRFFLIQGNYRKTLNYNKENMDNAKNAFSKLKNRIIEIKENLNGDIDKSKLESFKKDFTLAINNDLNTGNALEVLNNVIKSDELNNNEKVELINNFDLIFGLGLESLEKEKIDVPKKVEELAKYRFTAKQNKDWAKADELRDKIKELGFIIADSKDGYEIQKC